MPERAELEAMRQIWEACDVLGWRIATPDLSDDPTAGVPGLFIGHKGFVEAVVDALREIGPWVIWERPAEH